MFHMFGAFLGIDFCYFYASQVEHVVREEKAITAYDLVETYCELIVARMPIIESQKYVYSTCVRVDIFYLFL